jgi:transposase-like protein
MRALEEASMTSPLAVAVPTLHDGSMPEPASRRRFTTAYKLKVLAAAAQCTAPGAVGALLRREGLYSSHLTAWRAAQRAGTLSGPPRRRGPKPAVVSAQDVLVLERKLARAVARAERAEAILELQKKVAALLAEPLPAPDELR